MGNTERKIYGAEHEAYNQELEVFEQHYGIDLSASKEISYVHAIDERQRSLRFISWVLEQGHISEQRAQDLRQQTGRYLAFERNDADIFGSSTLREFFLNFRSGSSIRDSYIAYQNGKQLEQVTSGRTWNSRVVIWRNTEGALEPYPVFTFIPYTSSKGAEVAVIQLASRVYDLTAWHDGIDFSDVELIESVGCDYYTSRAVFGLRNEGGWDSIRYFHSINSQRIWGSFVEERGEEVASLLFFSGIATSDDIRCLQGHILKEGNIRLF